MPVQNRRIKRGWMNLKVSRVTQESPDTKTYYLIDAEDGGRQFDYIPGQYLTFRFDHIGPKPIVRSYTMSSSPNQKEEVAITVKTVEKGVVSHYLFDHVEVGTILRARGPMGKFVYTPAKDHKHLVMIAGGSGVTPFVSIMREFATQMGQPGGPKSLSLLVSHRREEDILCRETLDQIQSLPGIEIQTTLSREENPRSPYWSGRIDKTKLQKFINNKHPQESTFMICGPQPLTDLTVDFLKALPVPEEHIRLESFEN